MNVQVSAMQWGNLRHIADVKPIGDSDAPVLEEIRSVLERHDCLDRFGVTLLHNHFDLADGEILMETTDMEKREHFVRPMSHEALKAAGIEAQSTVIAFDEKGFRQHCGCDPRATGHHHK